MKRIVEAFSLWVVLATAAALLWPPSFGWVQGAWISPMLGVIMLGMGLTLTVDDFARVGRAPKPILLGVALQFTVMPALGFAIGKLFGLEPLLATGLILVACCPGGTASNVIAYIARADVALSVSMTTLSTLTAVLATPFLTSWLVGQNVAVNAWVLLRETAEVVLIPVMLGVSLRRFLPGLTARVLPVAPAVSVLAIVLIVGFIVSLKQQEILSEGLLLLPAVGLVHLSGAALGYSLVRLTGHSPQVARTISIEVGMQNAGLGTKLATGGGFPPGAGAQIAVPCVFSALWSCMLGSAIGAYWARRPVSLDDLAPDPAPQPS